MMKTMTGKPMRAWRTMAAMVTAGLLLALVGTPREAEATFPGEDGRIAFASNRTTGEGVNNPEGDFEIFTMNPDGTGLTQLTENAALDFDPEWSADGKRIAFESNQDGFSEIFMINADGSEQTKVTTNPDFSFDRSPTFSPDGERIAFESNRAAGVDNPEKDVEIFVVNLDGTGLQQLTSNAARELHPDYAPNGKKIAFVSERNFQPGIYTMNADGTKQKKRSQGSATVDSGPVFSPDGEKIAFQSNRDGNFEIFTMNADGTGQTNLTNDPAGDFTPDWQPVNGRH